MIVMQIRAPTISATGPPSATRRGPSPDRPLTNRLSRDGTLATLRQNGGKDLRLVISTRSNDAATTLKMKNISENG